MSAADLAGIGTAIGSLPGSDIDAAVALVFDALPDLPFLPELPARGPGADLVGRTAAQLVDLHVDLQPAGWRLVGRPGLDERRAQGLLAQDLDALVPVAAGYDGPLKTQLAGPWTLAASVELPRGGRAVADRGAVRDLVESLAETVVAHLDELRRRVPGARPVLQLDEPALPAVLHGRLPSASGLGTLPAVDPADARAGLQRVVAAAQVPVVVHCCADDVPVALLHEAGAAAVAVDLARAGLDTDEVAERVERGLVLWAGVVPALGPGAPPTVRELVEPVRSLARRAGVAGAALGDRFAVTPACGLAGASSGWARTALRLVTQTARALAESAAEPLRESAGEPPAGTRR